MRYHLTLIPGDGIGPEVVGAVTEILAAAGAPIDWEERIGGAAAIEAYGTTVPQPLLDSIRKNRVALKGPLTTPVGKGFRSANVTLRQELSLYACVRPVRNFPGLDTQYGKVDLVVIRENTEGLYSGIEHQIVPGVITSLKIISEIACRRIARFAFDYARSHGRRKITAVHKANVMKRSDGLFLSCMRAEAERHPYIDYEEFLIDNLVLELVLDPERFDLLVMENLYGDIVSDLCSGFVGGLGVVPGANIGEEYAVFEAVHGSAPDIAGKGIANPLALLLSALLMLEHIGEHELANRIRQATHRVLETGGVRTRDLGGKASTKEFTEAIIRELP
ncbi:MAG: NAD-dependent isocitrate dehydrogenase [Deltaproteobacteria bacterium]|nr:MAG: NAD-dependent isocitrate dehydrogenase [Deltaproteobacteria bacterium]